MKESVPTGLALLALSFVPLQIQAQNYGVENGHGLRLEVAREDSDPVLNVVLPQRKDADGAIRVLLPEHVTVKRSPATEEHLFVYRPGIHGERPAWKQTNHALEYERDFSDGLHLLARATLQEDGVLFHYELSDRSGRPYTMATAITDPRLTGIFHDVRLERTYVYHSDGFDLLASETPERLTMPLDQWLPARYLDSFTWPIPVNKKRKEDGITYYNKSRSVDQPMIATLSTDKRWIIASFARTAGNVWSNPELTCQHADPFPSLLSGGKVVWEVKMLVFEGSLDQALQKVKAQKDKLLSPD